MVKLVVLSGGLTGRTHELKADKTTVGRLEDNMFQIEEPSVSSHHCEVLLSGGTVKIRDLNSTNGSFINGEKITEAVFKPGQTLRLGQVELRLDTGDAASAPAAPAAAAAPPPPPGQPKKTTQSTLVMQRGVKLDDLDQSGRGGTFDSATSGFSKKDDKAGKIFWYLAGAFGLVIALLLIYVFAIAK